MVQFSRAMNKPDLTPDQLSGFFNYRYDISAEVPFTQQDHELIRQTLKSYNESITTGIKHINLILEAKGFIGGMRVS